MDLLYILDSLSKQKAQQPTDPLRGHSSRILVIKSTKDKFPFSDVEQISQNSQAEHDLVSRPSASLSRQTFFPKTAASFKKLKDLPKSWISGWKSADPNSKSRDFVGPESHAAALGEFPIPENDFTRKTDNCEGNNQERETTKWSTLEVCQKYSKTLDICG